MVTDLAEQGAPGVGYNLGVALGEAVAIGGALGLGVATGVAEVETEGVGTGLGLGAAEAETAERPVKRAATTPLSERANRALAMPSSLKLEAITSWKAALSERQRDP